MRSQGALSGRSLSTCQLNRQPAGVRGKAGGPAVESTGPKLGSNEPSSLARYRIQTLSRLEQVASSRMNTEESKMITSVNLTEGNWGMP